MSGSLGLTKRAWGTQILNGVQIADSREIRGGRAAYLTSPTAPETLVGMSLECREMPLIHLVDLGLLNVDGLLR